MIAEATNPYAFKDLAIRYTAGDCWTDWHGRGLMLNRARRVTLWRIVRNWCGFHESDTLVGIRPFFLQQTRESTARMDGGTLVRPRPKTPEEI
jgi:hypothetical protein